MVLIANGMVTAMAVIRMWSLDGENTLASLFDRFWDPSDLKGILARYHPEAMNRPS